MLDQRLRQTKERLLGPVARALGGRASPLALSTGALVVTLAAAGAAWASWYLLALALWLLGRLLDGLDGVVARQQHRATDVGGLLDVVFDTLGYAAVPIGIAAGLDERAAWIAVAVLLASFYVNSVTWTYLAAVLEKRSAGAAANDELTTTTMPSGLVEGTETIVLFSLMLLLPGLAVALFWVMAAAVFVTAAQRLVWAARGGL